MKIAMITRTYIYLLVVLVGVFVSTAVWAEVTLDGTMGTSGALAGPQYQIPAAVGQQQGSNLFHSFSTFNINAEELARFSGPADVQNIISRVTGGQSSWIDGVLQSTIPGASLYLLNPAGILFGSNAALDVQGSFYASTADYLKLNDGGRFDVASPLNSVLTAAPPAAFGFLQDSPASIQVQNSKLTVSSGQTMGLIGGDLLLSAAQLDAPSGELRLVSGGANQEVALLTTGLATSVVHPSGVISITSASRLDVSNTLTDNAKGAGRVSIRGGQLVMDGAAIAATTASAADGNVLAIDVRIGGEIRLDHGSTIAADSAGMNKAGDAGDIYLQAREITLDHGSLISSQAGILVGGAMANIKLKAGHLRVRNAAGIRTQAVFSGVSEGGHISIEAESIEMVGIEQDNVLSPTPTGIYTQSAIPGGKAGNIDVQANRQITLHSGAQLTSRAFGEREAERVGDSGDIWVRTGNLSLSDGSGIGALGGVDGVPGSVRVDAENITLRKAGKIGNVNIYEGGEGLQPGKVTVHVANNLLIDSVGFRVSDQLPANMIPLAPQTIVGINSLVFAGIDPVGATGIVSAAISGTGNAAAIEVSSSTIELRDVGLLGSITVSAGNGGRVDVSAAQSINITGVTQEGGSIIGSVAVQGNGRAGDLSIRAKNLSLKKGASIATSAESADGGDIALHIANQVVLSGGEITTSVRSATGGGGNIDIRNPKFVVLDNSRIQARAVEGKGGNINIGVNQLIQTPDSSVDASSVAGIDGQVSIASPSANLSENVVSLPSDFADIPSVLPKPCGQRAGGDVINLVQKRYDVLPDSPESMHVSLPQIGLLDLQIQANDLVGPRAAPRMLVSDVFACEPGGV